MSGKKIEDRAVEQKVPCLCHIQLLAASFPVLHQPLWLPWRSPSPATMECCLARPSLPPPTLVPPAAAAHGTFRLPVIPSTSVTRCPGSGTVPRRPGGEIHRSRGTRTAAVVTAAPRLASRSTAVSSLSFRRGTRAGASRDGRRGARRPRGPSSKMGSPPPPFFWHLGGEISFRLAFVVQEVGRGGMHTWLTHRDPRGREKGRKGRTERRRWKRWRGRSAAAVPSAVPSCEG